MIEHFNVRGVAANRSSRMIAEIIRKSGMESRDHFKNGVSPKDQMSRGNQLMSVKGADVKL